MWQPAKYPQGHLPYFTIHITKRCQNYSKKALVFDLSALCGLHEMDSRPCFFQAQLHWRAMHAQSFTSRQSVSYRLALTPSYWAQMLSQPVDYKRNWWRS